MNRNRKIYKNSNNQNNFFMNVTPICTKKVVSFVNKCNIQNKFFKNETTFLVQIGVKLIRKLF